MVDPDRFQAISETLAYIVVPGLLSVAIALLLYWGSFWVISNWDRWTEKWSW